MSYKTTWMQESELADYYRKYDQELSQGHLPRREPPPGLTEITADQMVGWMMNYGPAIIEHRREMKTDEVTGKTRWISWVMHHAGDGEGMAISQEYKNGVAQPAEIRYWRFRLCRHEWQTVVSNARRGYWEGKCSKCGQGRVTDSSD